MKKRIYPLLLLFFSLGIVAEEHIVISNPETWSAQELSEYIGQTVVFDSPMVVCSNENSPTLVVSPRRLFQATNQAIPRSTEYNMILALNNSGRITLTGVTDYHRCGEKIYNLKAYINSTNNISWESGEWRGNTRAELEAGLPELGNYRLLICTMNLEYYLAANLGSGTMGPLTKDAHDDQREKVSKALAHINADAYGLVEIEQGQKALEEIAGDLNKNIKGRNYTYIDDGTTPNGTYTKSGYIYDSNTLRPIGKMQDITTGVANRKKMLCFEEIATGERFIFSVNHFKAKRGPAVGKDADQGDGQGAYNAARVEEAKAVIRHYREVYKPALREPDILVMGDLNAYGKEDPIMQFLNNDFLDLHRSFHADSSYSYMFGGLAGYLDHALCNSTLYKQVTGVSGFHINSDENDKYTYDGKWNDNSMFRCSDHDPVLVGLALDSTQIFSTDPILNASEVLTGKANELVITNAHKEGQQSFYAIYNVSGWLVTSDAITGTHQSVSLPSEPGMYILYIYYDGHVYQKKFMVP